MDIWIIPQISKMKGFFNQPNFRQKCTCDSFPFDYTFLWFFAYYVMLCTTNMVPNTLCYTQCSQQLWWMVYTNTFRSTQKVQTRPYISYFLWQTNNCNLHGNIDKERYLSRYIVSYRIKSDIILITIEIHSGGIISGWDAIGNK